MVFVVATENLGLVAYFWKKSVVFFKFSTTTSLTLYLPLLGFKSDFISKTSKLTQHGKRVEKQK